MNKGRLGKMIRGLYIHEEKDMKEINKIRKQVFCIEQQISEDIEFATSPGENINLLVYDGEIPVATGQLCYEEEYYKIGHIAVLKEYRGKDFGDFVVRMLVDKALQMGAKEVHVIAQEYAKRFYEKIGFEIEGPGYIESNIPRLPMKLSTLHKCCHNTK